MDIPKVNHCEVEKCAYNRGGHCHATAITVGDRSHPKCDTFVDSSQHGGEDDVTGMVGACKVSLCSFNQNLECQAPKIDVQFHQGHADCGTFRSK